MHKRPLVIATMGYVIGIIWGLYLNISIASFFVISIICFLLIKAFRIMIYKQRLPVKSKIRKNIGKQIEYLVKDKAISNQKVKEKFKFFSYKKVNRYIKLILDENAILLLVIFSLISNFQVKLLESKYENLYKNLEEVNIIGKIIDSGTQKQYSKTYKIKVESVNGIEKFRNTILYANIKSNITENLKCGQKVELEGDFIEPERARNYKGFSQKQYFKTVKIYGSTKVKNVKIMQRENKFDLNVIFNKIFTSIKENIQNNMQREDATLLIAILFGDKQDLQEETKESFINSNLSHILAVSGLHISYMILIIEKLLKRLCGKRISPFITIFFILIYMFIADFSPSLARASIMGIIVLLGKILHRKSDICVSLSFSILIILIYNPYLITNAGLLLSYGGTIGILLFEKNIEKAIENIIQKFDFYKYKKSNIVTNVLNYVKNSLAVSISAQIVIAPITACMFHTFSITFFITNLLVSPIIGPIIISGFLFIILQVLYSKTMNLIFINKFIKIFFIILKSITTILLTVLKNISKFGEYIPLNKIYIFTLPMIIIVFYYIVIYIANIIYKINNKKKLSAFETRLINWKNLIRHKTRRYKKNIVIASLIIATVILVVAIVPKKLRVHFIDVGKGDSTLIITPRGKKILIDGGGSESYDVGKNVLVPYLLNRKITRLDYVIISHFDTDHVRTDY